jgi:virulence-associated protein VagC
VRVRLSVSLRVNQHELLLDFEEDQVLLSPEVGDAADWLGVDPLADEAVDFDLSESGEVYDVERVFGAEPEDVVALEGEVRLAVDGFVGVVSLV